MMGVAIVERQFCACFDRVECVKLCPFSNNSHEGIGCAGVVDETEPCCLSGSIDRLPIIDFHNGYALLDFGSLSSFPLGDAFPFVFANFLPLLQPDFGE